MASELPLPMPKMSMTMETGELLTWTVAEGDTIAAGDVVAEVQTDKVDMEVESPFAGTVARLVAQPGDTIAVGAPIAYLLSESSEEDIFPFEMDSPAPAVAAAASLSPPSEQLKKAKKRKVLLMGKSGSGKSSMRSIIFSNFLAVDTRRL